MVRGRDGGVVRGRDGGVDRGRDGGVVKGRWQGNGQREGMGCSRREVGRTPGLSEELWTNPLSTTLSLTFVLLSP